MGYFYFVYLWGYAARAVTSATTVSPRHLPQRGVQSLQKPPLPYHTPSPLTHNELCVTHLVVLTTEHEHVESEAYSVRV